MPDYCGCLRHGGVPSLQITHSKLFEDVAAATNIIIRHNMADTRECKYTKMTRKRNMLRKINEENVHKFNTIYIGDAHFVVCTKHKGGCTGHCIGEMSLPVKGF